MFLSVTSTSPRQSSSSAKTEKFEQLSDKLSLDTLTLSVIGLGILLLMAIVVGCLVLVVLRKRKHRENTELLELRRRGDGVAQPNSKYQGS